MGHCLLLVICCVLPPTEAMADPPQAQPLVESVTVRLKFPAGRIARYRLQLAGQQAWNPRLAGLQWGQMATDFEFTLHTKTVRPERTCTFDLLGETLRSTGKTFRGRIDVAATRQGSTLGVRGRDSVGLESRHSLLQQPMTVTLDSRGRFRYGTGLLPLAIYMLPHVDHRFWNLLAHAPEQSVQPGQRDDVSLQVPIPGAQGKTLQISGARETAGWKTVKGRGLLAIKLGAQLDVQDTNLVLKNGDRVHVVSGSYLAKGQALWDVDNGLLYSAEAQQALLLTADLPVPRALRSETKCSLKLLGYQDLPVPKKK
jgi:hypothetical protein